MNDPTPELSDFEGLGIQDMETLDFREKDELLDTLKPSDRLIMFNSFEVVLARNLFVPRLHRHLALVFSQRCNYWFLCIA